MKKISVIVPVYNTEKYLRKCIESIQQQTYQNIEILLIDDGSTDKSAEICDEYALKDSRIVVIHKKNGGHSSARNYGLDIAKGEYVFFVDCDDYIHESTLEILISKREISQADLVVCDYVWVDEDGIPEQQIPISEQKDDIMSGTEFLCKSSKDNGWRNIVVWNKLYKKEIFSDLRFELGKLYEDVFLFHEVCARSKKVMVTGEVLCFHTRRKDSITGNTLTQEAVSALEGYIARISYLIKIRDIDIKKTFFYTINHFFAVVVDYVNCFGCNDYKLNKLMREKRLDTIRIIIFLLQDKYRCKQERISLSVFFLSPKLYGKIWGKNSNG